jgi:hypothetical protein
MLTQNPPHAPRLIAPRQDSASIDQAPFPKHRQPLSAILATPLPFPPPYLIYTPLLIPTTPSRSTQLSPLHNHPDLHPQLASHEERV